MKPTRLTPILVASLAAASAFAKEPLRMDVRPAFTGIGGDTGAMTVILENDGPDVRGVVSIEGDTTGASYPVDLPQGARKRLLTFCGEGWSGSTYVLSTNRGRVIQRVNGRVFGETRGGSALLIGDDEGGLGFLRESRTEGKTTLVASDAYAKPELAPSRLTAYRTFNAVFLGPGAERIDDGAVEALKAYALGGGTLVFLGGASAPSLADARWADVLPGKDWQPRTVTNGAALATVGKAPLDGEFTVLESASLAPGARRGGTPFQTDRGIGLGRVAVLGYSPLDAPLNAWSGRAKAILPLLRRPEELKARQLTGAYESREVMTSGYGSAPGAYALGYSTPPLNDPFSTTLPPTGTVFGILGAYFLLVVPVSFLALRKLKRGELAWITAPLLSLGFAGALFKSAEGLYAASLSTASQGVLVLQQGLPGGTFYGSSQMFFPRGGTYDLRLDGVESLRSVSQEYGYGSDRLAGFNAVDVGEIEVPALEASNLAFRDMSYVQRIPKADWFSMTPLDSRRVRVENHSPCAFQGWLASGAEQSATFDLEPGASKVVRRGPALPTGSALPPTDVRNVTRRDGRLALSGRIVGLRPGPQIGREVQSQGGVEVVAFAREATR